ncbi:arylsulfatase [Sporosarcina obsidiansis]|uniref:arylsulfatase n=1 Tax=Sporosarcina obsidiansis TaxID=2660748 RepID=UPI00129ADED3|nr:arylsulfatase [Sporosarcina obsidiansis]
MNNTNKTEGIHASSSEGGGTKPNIVYIVFDDTGFSNFGCYGSEIATPNIDKLANHGLRYNNFNVSPLCSPTRASLLTGRNPQSVGMGHISEIDLGPNHPAIRGQITPSAATLAEVLKENGYGTYAVGKWHLTPSHEMKASGPFDNWPLGKGFQRFYGFLGGQTDQFTPDLVYDNHHIEPPKKVDYHLSEDLVDHAIQFVTDQKSVVPDKPFFLYLAFGATHSPHQVHKKYIDRYKGLYGKGWDQIRKERFLRQKQLGIIPNQTELPFRNPDVKPWDELTKNEKLAFERFQETFAGFLTHTDEQIGRLLDYLQKIGEKENTLVVLISDNGSSAEGGEIGRINSSSTFFNGIEEGFNDILERLDDIGGIGSDCNYPSGWAQAGNTPFKLYKKNTHHGGTRVPMIINWPAGIQDKGAIRTDYCHAIDVTPTILDILQMKMPESYRGIEQLPLHGISIASTFEGSAAPLKREAQYYLIWGNRAIWDDGWKAVTYHKHEDEFEQDKWELYHVDEDYSEKHDLADQYPEKLNELKALWWSEAKKYGALPIIIGGLGKSKLHDPEGIKSRNIFIYYPGMTRLHTLLTPPTFGRSYTITIPLNRSSTSCEGVLIAHGNQMSGYCLYIKNNLLIYEYNYLGTVYKMESSIDVPEGHSILSFEFTKIGSNSGNGHLYIDNKKVGEVFMPKTLPIVSLVGLDIGHDSLPQVSEKYSQQDEFPFTGEIEKVVFELRDDISDETVAKFNR